MPEERICRISKNTFIVSDKEIGVLKRMGIPLPDLAPTERLRRLMAFRNEWKLYRRKCDATGQDIISAYPADSPFKVYNNATWWGDSWDAVKYGRPFDFTRPFFKQFADLQKEVPREGTTIFNSENCDYNSHIRKSKNCYLNSLIFDCEDVYYSYWMGTNKNCYDCAYTNTSTLCFDSGDVNRCYNCCVLHESTDCTDCFFSYQLRNCQNCIFCTNLVHKDYYIWNKPVSKEEFHAFKKKLFSGSFSAWQKAKEDFLKLRREAVQRNVHTLNCENCTGDHIYNSKNCTNCFEVHECEDCENAVSLGDSKDIFICYSAGWMRCEHVYNSVVSRGSNNIAFCNYTFHSSNLRYCDSSISLQDCFGCVGLKHKRYCILNKQYSKEEYESLVPKIIEHMKKTASAQRELINQEYGEFFPPNMSPYAFNETAAMDFLPISKKEALEQGFRWREADSREYRQATLAELPDNINDVGEDITAEILACALCRKNYKIISQELKHYRVMQIPLPRKCPTCRHQERMAMRNPIALWTRQCAKCESPTGTSFSPERPETVYCEKCYLDAVY